MSCFGGPGWGHGYSTLADIALLRTATVLGPCIPGGGQWEWAVLQGCWPAEMSKWNTTMLCAERRGAIRHGRTLQTPCAPHVPTPCTLYRHISPVCPIHTHTPASCSPPCASPTCLQAIGICSHWGSVVLLRGGGQSPGGNRSESPGTLQDGPMGTECMRLRRDPGEGSPLSSWPTALQVAGPPGGGTPELQVGPYKAASSRMPTLVLWIVRHSSVSASEPSLVAKS